MRTIMNSRPPHYEQSPATYAIVTSIAPLTNITADAAAGSLARAHRLADQCGFRGLPLRSDPDYIRLIPSFLAPSLGACQEYSNLTTNTLPTGRPSVVE